MSDKAELKKKTEQDVRSILMMTTREGVALPSFAGTFKEYIGALVPFRELGFSSLIAYLQSIPHVVNIRSYGSDLKLFAVADEKTAHIEHLVRETKKGGKSRRGGRSTGARSRYSSSNSYYSNRDNSIHHKINTALNNLGCVPVVYRDKIKGALALMGVAGVEINDMADYYSRSTGTYLDFRSFGFQSLDKCLQSIPQIVTMRGNGTGKVFCISTEALNREKHPVKKDVSLATNNTDQPKPQKVDFPPEDDNMNKKIWKSIQRVFDQHKNGILIDDFLDEYKKINHVDLNYEEIGYFNLIEMVDHLPELFGIVPAEDASGNKLLFDARCSPPPAQRVFSANKRPIPQSVIDSIKFILQRHPNGLSLQKLENLYELTCKEKLPISQLGFYSMDSFMSHLMSYIKFIMFEDGGAKNVKMNPSINEDIQLINRHELTPSPELGVQPNNPNPRTRVIPSDAATCEDVYIPQRLTPETDLTQYIEVVVSDVTNPGFFWIQLLGIQYAEALETLMDHLETEYSGVRGNDYKVPHQYFLLNMPCVALYKTDWHRALMLGFPTKNLVEVHYVDYGTKLTIERQDIRLIKKKFMKFPTQAIKARLTLLKPLNSQFWSDTAGAKLLELTKGKDLLCKVYSVDEELERQSVFEEDPCVKDVGFPDNNKDPVTSTSSSDPDFSFAVPHTDSVQSFPKPIKSPPGLTKNKFSLDMEILQRLASKVIANENTTYSTTSFEPIGTEPIVTEPDYNTIFSKFHKFPANATTSGATCVTVSPMSFTVTKPIDVTSPINTACRVSSPDSLASTSMSNDAAQISHRITKEVCFVKNKYSGHIININSKPHLTSEDISYYIFGSDIILIMCKRMKLGIEIVDIVEKENPQLFIELRLRKVRGFNDAASADKHLVSLFTLESCVEVLEKINFSNKELVIGIQREIDNFNPNDPYWTELLDEELITDEIDFILLPKQMTHLKHEWKKITKLLSEEDDQNNIISLHQDYMKIMDEYLYASNVYKYLCEKRGKDVIGTVDKATIQVPNTSTALPLFNAQRNVQQVAPIPTQSAATLTRSLAAATNNGSVPSMMLPNPLRFGNVIPAQAAATLNNTTAGAVPVVPNRTGFNILIPENVGYQIPINIMPYFVTPNFQGSIIPNSYPQLHTQSQQYHHSQHR